MLVGAVLRSPHAHARIRSLDTSKAEALPGVKAVLTSADLPRLPFGFEPAGEAMVNYRDMSENILAYKKVLYDGHAVAAVAAVDLATAEAAVALIEVDYEVLPHVIDPVEAMKPDAPDPARRSHHRRGRPEAGQGVQRGQAESRSGRATSRPGFAEADIVVEREFDTQAVHQGYIEPHACVGSVSEDGQAEVWCCTQGQYTVRGYCAKLLGMDISKIRVTPSEIGGGFGGKTVVYLEPLALGLSRKACQPVKMTMSRTEVFRATGPTSGGNVRVKMGVTRDGRITAAQAELVYQAGAFGGSPVQPGCMCAFAPYDVRERRRDRLRRGHQPAQGRCLPGAGGAHLRVRGRSRGRRARGGHGNGPHRVPAQERRPRRDQGRLRSEVRPGRVSSRPWRRQRPPSTTARRSAPNQGRGVASGFWFNIGGETCATLHVGEDGTVALVAGTPDIGGSRASLAMMAAEELGIELDKVRPMIADTASLGYTFLTGGSRVTFASGMAVVEAARSLIQDLRERAAKIWDIPVDAVVWENGRSPADQQQRGRLRAARPRRPRGVRGQDRRAAQRERLAQRAGGGPHLRHPRGRRRGGPRDGARPGGALHRGPGRGQGGPPELRGRPDPGRRGAGHRLGAQRGVHLQRADGQLENPGFLDYRVPVCSDVPMIDAVIIEEPNPRHPYGVRGVGETPIVPPMGAITNAVANAIGIRMTSLPMSPPRVLEALDEAAATLPEAAD